MACFNCESADAQRYSFDLDLPTIEACGMCVFALSTGDLELLAVLKPRREKVVARLPLVPGTDSAGRTKRSAP